MHRRVRFDSIPRARLSFETGPALARRSKSQDPRRGDAVRVIPTPDLLDLAAVVQRDRLHEAQVARLLAAHGEPQPFQTPTRGWRIPLAPPWQLYVAFQKR